jgi:signal transduction histidine kinase
LQYFPTYLIYFAVVARAIGWIQDSSPIGAPVWILLGLFGLVLFSEQMLSRRLAWYPRPYTLVQSGLVIAMLYLAPALDFLPMLFFPLSFQAVRFFRHRVGFAWIGAFSVAMTGMFFRGLEWQPGIVMLLASSGANVLMGSFAHLMTLTDRRREENQQLLGNLQEAYRQLKDSAAQAEALAAAEERHRLVRELHDSLTQTLFSMNLSAQVAQLSMQEDARQVDEHLARLQTLSRSAASEVQALTGQIPQPHPAQEGLGLALARLAEERLAQDGLHVNLEMAGRRRLSEPVEAALYRIVQEALNNIIRHAHTRQARVRIDLERPLALLEIEDSGCGFDPEPLKQSSGYGLAGMAERAGEIGWDLEIESHPGGGTRIRVREKAA